MSSAGKAQVLCDHDVAPGPLKRCQITGSENLHLVIDLGHQPLCDTLVDEAGLDQPEKTYPLRLFHCPDSGLAQLDYAVDGRELYAPSYPYRAGVSWPIVKHHGELAEEILRRMSAEGFNAPFCVDIGSNDGTLLAQLKKRGAQVLGVEPTDVGKIAVAENNVPTMQAFFNEEAAREIVEERGGRAQVITTTSVFAHMATLGEVMRGICRLLSPGGMFVIETHYLLNVLDELQFDTVYHEHLRTYSLKSLCALFPQYGLEVFDVERTDRYGGDLRAFVQWAGVRPVSPRVHDMLQLEEDRGLHDLDTWLAWRADVMRERDRFMEWLYGMRRSGKRVAGVSCPGRCSTLLNYYGIGPDLIEYLGEVPGSLKIGKHLPGRLIPVVPNTRFAEDKPDALVLMAWHLGRFIAPRLRREGYDGLIVRPLPLFQVDAPPPGIRPAEQYDGEGYAVPNC